MAEIKRLHYYDHQYLREPDFTAEQKYHLDMRRLHNKSLHIFGVVNGLDISKKKQSDTAIIVSSGMALDRDGRELVLDTDRELTIDVSENGDRYVSIKYKEEQTDPPPPEFVISDIDRTRWTESVEIEVTKEPPSDTGLNIILGHVKVLSNKIDNIDDGEAPNHRRYSGASGEGHFSRVGIGTTSPAAALEVNGDLKVTGSLIAGLPIGTILMYDGTDWKDNDTLPGWYAMTHEDKNIGLKDLRDKFVMGSVIAGAKGGSNSIILTVENIPVHHHSINHDHAAISFTSGGQSANHTHNNTQEFFYYQFGGINWSPFVDELGKGAHYGYITPTGGESANHNHTVAVDLPPYIGNSGDTGSAAAFDNRPAFYAIIFIRRCN